MIDIKEVIVVEGRSDTAAIHRALRADTIETGGSAVDDATIATVRFAQERRGVIILTDADYPGEQIRKKISRAVPGCKHAFIARNDSRAKNGNVGVEHASPATIRHALEHARATKHKSARLADQVDRGWRLKPADLHRFGLSGGRQASERRARIGQLLGIGFANAKQFSKRLDVFRITKEEFEAAYRQAIQEGDSSNG